MNPRFEQALQHENVDESKSFDRVILDIVCNATIGIPISVSLIGVILVAMALDSFPVVLLSAWLTAHVIATWARFWALRFWLPKREDIDDQRKLYIASYFSLTTGLIAAASIAFFPGYTIAERGIQTMMVLSTITGTIVSVAGYRPHVLAYAGPPAITLGMAWALSNSPGNVGAFFLLGILTLIFFWVLTHFSKLLNDSLYESYESQQVQRRLNQQLSVALQDSEAANESKSLFFASASHDLRQPIHTLSLLTAALSMRSMDEESEEILGHIDTAVDNLSTQMDSMLDIAKLDAGVFKAEISNLNCSALLGKMNNEYRQSAQSKSLEFHFELPEKEIYVNSDGELLERVLRNLLDNAIKYTLQGSITLRLTYDGAFVYIDVIDTGIGIADRDKLKIFDEFYQISNPSRDRSRGLGLGLSIVKRITDLLDISLDFHSEHGSGSTFTVSIKRSHLTSKTRSSDLEPSQPIEYDRNKTLLCIDDEVEVLNAMTILLSDLGYSVITATSSDRALELLKTNHPDVVLADFRLADNNNGIDAINLLRTKIPALPAILISGDTGKDRLQQAASANIPLLSKPIRVETLERTIAEITR